MAHGRTNGYTFPMSGAGQEQGLGMGQYPCCQPFKSGAINSFNFRDIQLRYINASIRRLEAIFDLIDTETELLRLTGGIVSEE